MTDIEVAIIHYDGNNDMPYADLVVDALREKMVRETTWHNTATPPPENGLYWGKFDDSNSMYAVIYKDGKWALSAYPYQKRDVIQWAFWDAFQDNCISLNNF